MQPEAVLISQDEMTDGSVRVYIERVPDRTRIDPALFTIINPEIVYRVLDDGLCVFDCDNGKATYRAVQQGAILDCHLLRWEPRP